MVETYLSGNLSVILSSVEKARPVVVVEGTKATVPFHLETEAFCDTLNGKVAKSLDFCSFHKVRGFRG